MKSLAVVAVIFALLVPMLAGCQHMCNCDEEAACTCEEGKAGGTTWCAACEKGYVEGEAVSCEGCYAAKTGGVPCPKCSAK